MKDRAPLIVAIAALLVAGLALVEARRTDQNQVWSHDGHAYLTRNGNLYRCFAPPNGTAPLSCHKVKFTLHD